MAIAYSYPTATPELQDLLIGTNFLKIGEKTITNTVNFTIASLVSLVSPLVINKDDFVQNTDDVYTSTPKITQAVTLSLSQYNAIPVKKSSTLYVII